MHDLAAFGWPDDVLVFYDAACQLLIEISREEFKTVLESSLSRRAILGRCLSPMTLLRLS